MPADRELTGDEKTLAEETDIDAEELQLPDSTVDEFSRGVTDLDAAKEDDEGLSDRKVSGCTDLWPRAYDLQNSQANNASESGIVCVVSGNVSKEELLQWWYV